MPQGNFLSGQRPLNHGLKGRDPEAVVRGRRPMARRWMAAGRFALVRQMAAFCLEIARSILQDEAVLDPARFPLRAGPSSNSTSSITADFDPVIVGLPMLSFWLAASLLSALLFKVLWNQAARRSASWPRLGFKAPLAALAIVCLIPAGALLLAEEIRPQFRRMVDSPQATSSTPEAQTAIALRRLGGHLIAYAASHGGYLPEQPYHLTTGAGEAADAGLWRAPGADHLLFTYLPPIPPRPVDQLNDWIVAWEPATSRPGRLALTADGTVLELDSGELRDRVNSQLRQLLEPDGSTSEPEPSPAPSDSNRQSDQTREPAL